MRFERQAGVALITVLLVVALAATLASFISWRQQVWTRQVENLRDAGQGDAIAHAGLDWAGAILAEDRRKNQVDHPEEAWAMSVDLPVERGRVLGSIHDAQACFNLNNLVRDGQPSEPDIAAFQRLLGLLKLPSGLSDSLMDWLDEDSQPRGEESAEDPYYLAREDAHHAANRPLASLGELRLIKGFDVNVVEALAPHVCVLPVPSRLNVNTAGAEALAAMIPGLDPDAARKWVEHRGAGAKTLEAFKDQFNASQKHGMHDQLLGVASDFFQVSLEVEFGRVRQRYLALYRRDGQNPPLLLWLQRR